MAKIRSHPTRTFTQCTLGNATATHIVGAAHTVKRIKNTPDKCGTVVPRQVDLFVRLDAFGDTPRWGCVTLPHSLGSARKSKLGETAEETGALKDGSYRNRTRVHNILEKIKNKKVEPSE